MKLMCKHLCEKIADALNFNNLYISKKKHYLIFGLQLVGHGRNFTKIYNCSRFGNNLFSI